MLVHKAYITVHNRILMHSDEVVEYKGKTYNGFYVSYNDYDRVFYGGVITALVLGQMEVFLILNGNHAMQYIGLEGKPFSAYYDYYISNKEYRNDYSSDAFDDEDDD